MSGMEFMAQKYSPPYLRELHPQLVPQSAPEYHNPTNPNDAHWHFGRLSTGYSVMQVSTGLIYVMHSSFGDECYLVHARDIDIYTWASVG